MLGLLFRKHQQTYGAVQWFYCLYLSHPVVLAFAISNRACSEILPVYIRDCLLGQIYYPPLATTGYLFSIYAGVQFAVFRHHEMPAIIPAVSLCTLGGPMKPQSYSLYLYIGLAHHKQDCTLRSPDVISRGSFAFLIYDLFSDYCIYSYCDAIILRESRWYPICWLGILNSSNDGANKLMCVFTTPCDINVVVKVEIKRSTKFKVQKRRRVLFQRYEHKQLLCEILQQSAEAAIGCPDVLLCDQRFSDGIYQLLLIVVVCVSNKAKEIVPEINISENFVISTRAVQVLAHPSDVCFEVDTATRLLKDSARANYN
ncbi:hypothetical protein GQX74_013755 [Glossina fuscipes]|nr:hypothetical protein GQX74_013755 [Glossina fuscipes]